MNEQFNPQDLKEIQNLVQIIKEDNILRDYKIAQLEKSDEKIYTQLETLNTNLIDLNKKLEKVVTIEDLKKQQRGDLFKITTIVLAILANPFIKHFFLKEQ